MNDIFDQLEYSKNKENISTSVISKFTNILELSSILSNETDSKEENKTKNLKLSNPISIDHLEMLEAELHNQGILSKTLETISQRVRHDTGLLGWHARRFGIAVTEIEFLVNVPEYIVKKAKELENDINSSTQSVTVYPRELNYLDEFSSFILGRFDNTENQYEDGLNVVLKALIKSAEASSETLEKILSISLPKTRAEFLKELSLAFA